MSRSINGSTLFELLTTLAIAAILTSIAASTLSSTAKRSRLNSGLEALLHALDRTRSLAVIRGKRAAFCLTDATDQCNSEWEGQYLTVFMDDNRNRRYDADEEVFIRQPWETSHLNISWNRPKESAIVFQPDGTVVLNCTLILYDESGSVFKKLVISKVGRTRIE